jgi:hypothetical protein
VSKSCGTPIHSKMKILRTRVIFLTIICAALTTCSKKTEDPFPTDMRQTVSTDAEFESMTNEVDDLVISGLTKADVPTGRYAAFTDDRIACAKLSFDSTANRVTGSVVIDFATGCTDARGNTRTGKILISWTGGRWFKVGSHTTATFQNYAVNGVSFADNNGSTLHNVSSVSSPLTWTIESFYNLTWPNQSGGNRIIHQTRQWVPAANSANDKFIVAQSRSAAAAATGTNRYGKTYSSVITTPLEYVRSCVLSNKVLRPVKGVRTITYDSNKAVTMDFGNGTCDGSFTATTAATTRTITFKNDGAVD